MIAGMASTVRQQKSPMEQVVTTFRQRFDRLPEALAFAPGRVNLLGEHVDFNQGLVMPAAIDRLVVVAFAASHTNRSTLVAVDFSQESSFTPASLQARQDALGEPLPGWACYPAGVAWALGESGYPAPAMEAVYASDVPRGAGLSSSAAVEMAYAVAWSHLGGWSVPPMQMAQMGQKAENFYVGVNCGIMDQFASLCGVAGHILLLDCRSLDWRPLPIPPGTSIVIADSSLRRDLTSSGYNERWQDCQDAVRVLGAAQPGVKSLRDVSVEEFNRLCGSLSPRVEKRARHVVEEIERTRQAIPFLEQGNGSAFGKLMYQSHASLRDLYDVSTPELNAMVEIALDLPGCLGARLTGAGFGGCTVNLVESPAVEAFSTQLASRYERQCGLKPGIHVCQASQGARVTSFDALTGGRE